MSTATYDRPLYAVPAPPDQKARFAFLLAVRQRAQQALDAVLALPRGAAGWAVRHLRSLLDSNTQRLAGWCSNCVRGAVTLVRTVGLIPLAATLLSTPAVWSHTTQLARLGGSAIASIARTLAPGQEFAASKRGHRRSAPDPTAMQAIRPVNACGQSSTWQGQATCDRS